MQCKGTHLTVFAPYHLQRISALETTGALSCLSSSSTFYLKHIWVLVLEKQLKKLITRDIMCGVQFPPFPYLYAVPSYHVSLGTWSTLSLWIWVLSHFIILVWSCWAVSFVKPPFHGESVTPSRPPSFCFAQVRDTAIWGQSTMALIYILSGTGELTDTPSTIGPRGLLNLALLMGF